MVQLHTNIEAFPFFKDLGLIRCTRGSLSSIGAHASPPALYCLYIHAERTSLPPLNIFQRRISTDAFAIALCVFDMRGFPYYVARACSGSLDCRGFDGEHRDQMLHFSFDWIVDFRALQRYLSCFLFFLYLSKM